MPCDAPEGIRSLIRLSRSMVRCLVPVSSSDNGHPAPGQGENEWSWRTRLGRLKISWRRRQVDVFDSHDVNCILDAGPDVLRIEVRVIIANDFRKAKPFTHQFQHALHRNSSARNTRFSEMDLRVDGDSLFHVSSSSAC